MKIGLGLGVNRGGGVGLTRASFIARITAIVGSAPVAGFLPLLTDTTTSTDPWAGGTWTADGDMTGQITAQGRGAARAFVSASSRYLTRADSSTFSFGNGTTDSAFSIVTLANITDTAAQRALLSKWAAGNAEWTMVVTAADLLNLTLVDQSASVFPSRSSDAAITQGSWRVFGASYDGTGGATAANGITLYQDGAVIASTAGNNASYVAMEDLGAALEIGTILAHTAQFLDGSTGFTILVAGALSTAQHAAIVAACKSYFGAPV